MKCAPLVILLGGCATVGPDFRTPQVAVPEKFTAGGVSWTRAQTGVPSPSGAWWKVYGDATLNGLVADALRDNQSLEAAAARLREAEALSRAARLRVFPDVNLTGGWERTRSRPRFNGPSSGSQLHTGTTLDANFSYELDLWGKVRRQIEAAGANRAASALAYQAAALSLSGQTAQTYFTLRSVDAERAILRRALDLRRQALELLNRQREAGAIADLDVLRAQTEVANAEADLIALEQNRAELLAALALLTGRPAGTLQLAERESLPEPPRIPAELPSSVVARRPDIGAALLRVVAANAEIGVAQAAFYPSVTLGASAGFDSPGGGLFSSTNQIWSLGPNVRLPLSGAGVLRAQRDAAVARHAEATATYRQTVLTAFEEVESSLAGVTVLARLEAARQQAVGSADRTFELARQRYTAGMVSFLEVVDADRVRVEALRQASRTRGQRLAASATLARALGGPWR